MNMKSRIFILIIILYVIGETKGRNIRVECKRWKEACVPTSEEQPEIKPTDYIKGKMK